jgi:pimeloyl-ACP methyl ester carboxylesterase
VSLSLSGPLTSMLDGPDGALEYLLTGSGDPVTVFAHGLAGSIETTRPFGSGVPGTRAFFHFRGHGASVAPESDWTYAALAAELGAVAEHVGASQALGVSMGAGAICSLLEQTPDRFARLVFVMPAVLDQPREDEAIDRLVEMAEHADQRDVGGMARLLLLDQPAEVRDQPAVKLWCRRQAATLVGTPVSRALRALPHGIPLKDRASLRAVPAPALVVAQEDDAAHPVRIAEELAAALPEAQLEVLPPGGIMWRHRARVRALIGDFLSGATAP